MINFTLSTNLSIETKKLDLNNPFGLKIKDNVVYIANRHNNQILGISLINLITKKNYLN